MCSETQNKKFVQWLNSALQDERWRAFIRAQVQQHELPVIEFDAGKSRRPGAAALRQRPR